MFLDASYYRDEGSGDGNFHHWSLTTGNLPLVRLLPGRNDFDYFRLKKTLYFSKRRYNLYDKQQYCFFFKIVIRIREIVLVMLDQLHVFHFAYNTLRWMIE